MTLFSQCEEISRNLSPISTPNYRRLRHSIQFLVSWLVSFKYYNCLTYMHISHEAIIALSPCKLIMSMQVWLKNSMITYSMSDTCFLKMNFLQKNSQFQKLSPAHLKHFKSCRFIATVKENDGKT